MPDSIPRMMLEAQYFSAAQASLRKLKPGNIMEATPQARQREISLSSFDLVHSFRPDIQYFNDLLVQYPVKGRKRPTQVVPDNMVVVHREPIEAEGSYDVPLQPVGPFWVLEYVSKSNQRKDYVENMVQYEQELCVPYYLLFAPDAEEMNLYRHNGEKYVTVLPNEYGRYPIPELEMEVRILDGWVRYWFRGQLLPLPAELQRALDQARREIAEVRQEAELARQEATRAQEEAAQARQEAASAIAGQKAMEQEIARLRQMLAQESQARLAPGTKRGTDSPTEPQP